MPELITIERHILDEQRQFPLATGVFTRLLYDIALSAKLIARETTRAGLANILGRVGEINIQGEEQQKLDVYADETIRRMVEQGGRLCIMASEEHKDPLPIPASAPCGDYVLLYDPLDGSSNIDYNVVVGTIFSIHRKITEGERGSLADLLQPGLKQVAAGYVLYGSSTMLVYTTGAGVHGFTLDPAIGEFVLSHPALRFPDKPVYYGVNYGNQPYWTAGIGHYVNTLNTQHELSLRYIGSLVGDFHRTLLSGGVFLYPADRKEPARPYGKLRLTYECAPLAFIAEQAGGLASDGVNPIRWLQPSSLHQRVPFIVGNRSLVEEAEGYIRQHDSDWLASYQAQIVLTTTG